MEDTHTAPETIAPGITDEELAWFVGKNSEYYLKKWREKKPTFNVVVFFFALYWLAYRKMYSYVVIFTSILLASFAVELFVTMPAALDRIFSIAIGTICGLGGNTWYKNHAIKTIQNIKALSYNEEKEKQEIINKGGGNHLTALLVCGAFIAIAIVFAMASITEATIEETAAQVVDDIFKENPQLGNITCIKVEIKQQLSENVYEAIALLSSNEHAKLKIEVQNDLIYVTIEEYPYKN